MIMTKQGDMIGKYEVGRGKASLVSMVKKCLSKELLTKEWH